MRNSFAKLSTSIALCGPVCLAFAAEPVSAPERVLTGDWVLCRDDDRNPKDLMRFSADGTGLSVNPIGSDAPGTPFRYRVDGEALVIRFDLTATSFEISLRVSETRDQLFLDSPRTGGRAVYVKAGDEARFACDVV